MKGLSLILRSLAFFVGVVTFSVGGFYLEEDLRGAREWQIAQTRLQQAGNPLSFKDLRSPGIPDEQNLGALPPFKWRKARQGSVDLASDPLEKALENILPILNYPFGLRRILVGKEADLAAVAKYISDRYLKVFGKSPGLLSPLEQFDALCPVLPDLRRAAETRTECRFSFGDETRAPQQPNLSSLQSILHLGETINLHALVALEGKKPEMALADSRLAFAIDEGLRHEPLLIFGLVASAGCAIQLTSIWNGLRLHAWSSTQLTELQQMLRKTDLLSGFQLSLRGEAIGYFVPQNDYLRVHRSELAQAWQFGLGADFVPAMQKKNPSFLTVLLAYLIPNGWFDMAKARGITENYYAASYLVDPGAHRVFPERLSQLKRKIESLSSLDLVNDMLMRLRSGTISVIPHFAETQSRVDAALIACALERYRLAHGNYPDSLRTLAGDSPLPLPVDVVNGQPFRYKTIFDGSCLLYSVGWNQIDEGGLVSRDRNQGDWLAPRLVPTTPNQ